MSECMTFPDTVEEFMDSYKIVDTEQVYTNGTEMVPIYRMRQWFQHEPERKKGKWIPQDHNKITDMASTMVFYYPKCSECGHSGNYTNFCPRCGADMRGDDHDL